MGDAMADHGADAAAQSSSEERKKQMLKAKIVKSAKKKIEETEKMRLKELLKNRLMEAGWHDEMADYCREVIRNKSLEHLDIEALVNEIAPRSRAAIPDSIRDDIARRISDSLDQPGKAK